MTKSSGYKPPESVDELLDRYQQGERDFGGTALDQAENDFQGKYLEGINFSPGSFLFANFQKAHLRGANFSQCNVKCCDFRGADLRDAKFTDSAIDSAEFVGANLEGTDFTGASFYGLQFGNGEKPDW